MVRRGAQSRRTAKIDDDLLAAVETIMRQLLIMHTHIHFGRQRTTKHPVDDGKSDSDVMLNPRAAPPF